MINDQKASQKDVSLLDLSPEERATIKEYFKHQVKSTVNSKYPTMQVSRTQRHIFNFLKHFSFEDYSSKGQKSAL